MNIIWPPEKTVDYKAKNPNKENGIVVVAVNNQKQEKQNKSENER